MKTKFLSVALLTLIAISVAITPTNAAVKVEGDAYAGMSSMYLWRGFDLSNGDPVVQGGMDVSFKGFTLSYWSNLDLNTGEMNETDYTIDYSTDLSDLVSLSVGNIFYALDSLGDTNELYVGVGLNILLSPSFTVYYDYDRAQEDGLFFTLGIGHDLKLSDALSVSLGGLVSYNQKSDYAIGNYSALHNFELSTAADYAINDQVSLSPYLIYSDALSNDAESVIKDELAGGLNLTISF